MGWALPYLGRPRGCLLASSGCLPRDGERARAPRGLLALRRVPLLSLVLGAEGCDWPWGPEVGPGAPEDEVPGAANTIQSGRAMLVSLLARSRAGGTVSPAPGGPRRRAAYLGDSWKGTERAQWQEEAGRGRWRPETGERQEGRKRDERVRAWDGPPTSPQKLTVLQDCFGLILTPTSGRRTPWPHPTPPSAPACPLAQLPQLTHVLLSMVPDELPQFKIPSDHCHLGVGVGVGREVRWLRGSHRERQTTGQDELWGPGWLTHPRPPLLPACPPAPPAAHFPSPLQERPPHWTPRPQTWKGVCPLLFFTSLLAPR